MDPLACEKNTRFSRNTQLIRLLGVHCTTPITTGPPLQNRVYKSAFTFRYVQMKKKEHFSAKAAVRLNRINAFLSEKSHAFVVTVVSGYFISVHFALLQNSLLKAQMISTDHSLLKAQVKICHILTTLSV